MIPHGITTAQINHWGDTVWVYDAINIQSTSQHVDGLAKDCSNSIANAMELPQSCTKPSICLYIQHFALPLSISTGWCKKDVTPLLMHWSYIFLALTHRYMLQLAPIPGPWLHGCIIGDLSPDLMALAASASEMTTAMRWPGWTATTLDEVIRC